MNYAKTFGVALSLLFATALVAGAQSTPRPTKRVTVRKVETPFLLTLASGQQVTLVGVTGEKTMSAESTEAARAKVASMIEGKRVVVELYGVFKGIVHGYVTAEESKTDVNAEVLRLGLGRMNDDRYHPNFDKYREIQDEARAARVGLWAQLAPAPETSSTSESSNVVEFSTTDIPKTTTTKAPKGGAAAPAAEPGKKSDSSSSPSRKSRSGQAAVKQLPLPKSF